MSSKIGKQSKSVADFRLHSRIGREQREERFDEVLESVSLNDVPLDERRREAEKPLYLARYE
jgi:hypothetical protein